MPTELLRKNKVIIQRIAINAVRHPVNGTDENLCKVVNFVQNPHVEAHSDRFGKPPSAARL